MSRSRKKHGPYKKRDPNSPEAILIAEHYREGQRKRKAAMTPEKSAENGRRIFFYFPDILVEYTSGAKEIIEVKPEAFVKDINVQLKANAALEFCKASGYGYTFWTEKELKIAQGV